MDFILGFVKHISASQALNGNKHNCLFFAWINKEIKKNVLVLETLTLSAWKVGAKQNVQIPTPFPINLPDEIMYLDDLPKKQWMLKFRGSSLHIRQKEAS